MLGRLLEFLFCFGVFKVGDVGLHFESFIFVSSEISFSLHVFIVGDLSFCFNFHVWANNMELEDVGFI